jgi:hypothetical protein
MAQAQDAKPKGPIQLSGGIGFNLATWQPFGIDSADPFHTCSTPT